MALCEAGFPRKLAFAYLEDLEAEFSEQYGKKVPSVSRPYSLIEFGKKLQNVSYSRSSILEYFSLVVKDLKEDT